MITAYVEIGFNSIQPKLVGQHSKHESDNGE